MHGCAWPLRAHPCRWSARPPQEHTAVSASAAVSEGALFVRGYHVVYLCVYACIDACLHRWMDGWMYLLHTHPHPHNSRTHKLNAHTPVTYSYVQTQACVCKRTSVRTHTSTQTGRQSERQRHRRSRGRSRGSSRSRSRSRSACAWWRRGCKAHEGGRAAYAIDTPSLPNPHRPAIARDPTTLGPASLGVWATHARARTHARDYLPHQKVVGGCRGGTVATGARRLQTARGRDRPRPVPADTLSWPPPMRPGEHDAPTPIVYADGQQT